MIPDSGQTEPVYCLATTTGIWAVPAGTVNGENLRAGVVPGNLYQPDGGSAGDGRTKPRVVSCSGDAGRDVQCARYAGLLPLRAEKVNGVQENLISFRQATLGKWVAVVGGGDPYEVAYAIYKAVPDISILTNDVSNPSGAEVEKKTIPVTVYPDVYQVPFVVPSSQNVVVLITELSVDDLHRSGRRCKSGAAEYRRLR